MPNIVQHFLHLHGIHSHTHAAFLVRLSPYFYCVLKGHFSIFSTTLPHLVALPGLCPCPNGLPATNSRIRASHSYWDLAAFGIF